LVIAELVMGTLAGYPHAPQLETRILHSAIFNLHPIPPKTAGPSKRTIFDFQSIPPENGGTHNTRNLQFRIFNLQSAYNKNPVAWWELVATG
jgi:hypothetical protein